MVVDAKSKGMPAKRAPEKTPAEFEKDRLKWESDIIRAKALARRQATQAEVDAMAREIALASQLSRDPEVIKQYQKRRKIMYIPKILYRAGNYISPKIYRGLRGVARYVSPTLYKYAVSPLWEGVKGVGSSIAKRARAVHDYMMDEDPDYY